MDARHPIQSGADPVVLSCAFNESGTRLICGLDRGVKAFRARDCVLVLDECPDPGYGNGIAVAVDDRYVALVGGGRQANTSANKVIFWDNLQGRLITTLDLSEAIVGLRVTSQYCAIVLAQRAVVLHFVDDLANGGIRPGAVNAIHDTFDNPFGLCCIRGDRAVLPGLTSGQVQIIGLAGKTKKVIRAHNSDLRQLDLIADTEILVTASLQGTLIRVFSVSAMVQTHEFRRGVDAAIIYSLAISPRSQFVACTSDKGTLHVFDLRPLQPNDARSSVAVQRRTSTSRLDAPGRRPASNDRDALSLPSQASSPRPGSQVGVYGVPEDIVLAVPATAPSALSALAKLPGIPKAFSDARSMTSISYSLGPESRNWQGQPGYVATTLPNNQTVKVPNPNVPIAGYPDGRPPKGILCWDPQSGDRRIWCVGGGSRPKWEVFELHDVSDGRLRLVNPGHRKYLTRQFPLEGQS